MLSKKENVIKGCVMPKSKESMMDVKKYIAHIVSKKSEDRICLGVGVFVEDMLITAGHVINPTEVAYAYANGKRYMLDESNRIFYQSMGNDDHEPMHNDVAIYRIEGINSPFRLATHMPKKSDRFMNVYIVEKTDESPDSNNPVIFNKATKLSLEQCGAEHNGEMYGNFIMCGTEKQLGEGNSGCPLIKDDTVYGILHGGVPDEQLCAYQSSLSILRCLGQ